jgi:hydroxyacyl-ACP dehydratase HTD2-like protein with hotdog domain
MWAGGSFEWNATSALQIGTTVTEVTRVAAIERKKNMIFVHQEKKYYPEGATVWDEPDTDGAEGDDAWGVRERRIHVFRTDEDVKAGLSAAAGAVQGTWNEASFRRVRGPTVRYSPLMAAPSAPITAPLHPAKRTFSADDGTFTFTYTPTSPLLFRYSALTFNAHKIHYDRDWVRNVEGHPDLVVHGPLTATLLVELASIVARKMGKALRNFEYRATKGMYVGRQVAMRATFTEAQSDPYGSITLNLAAEQSGAVGMKATAVLR